MKTIAAHLSKELKQQFRRRSLGVRTGDEVQIMRGTHAGKTGKISKVDTEKKKIYITGIVDKRTVGTEVQIPFDPSKIRILNPDLADEKRRKIILRKVKEVKYEKKPKLEAKKIENEKAKEVKEEVKTKEEGVKKHEVEKTADTKVLETAKKAKNVGGKSKAGSAQKV